MDNKLRSCLAFIAAFTLAFMGLFVIYLLVASKAENRFAGVLVVAFVGFVVCLLIYASGKG